jgi:hypothetical protein
MQQIADWLEKLRLLEYAPRFAENGIDISVLPDKSSWLLGNFTQNAPCKGDGSDPAELKVRIAADQVARKSEQASISVFHRLYEYQRAG